MCSFLFAKVMLLTFLWVGTFTHVGCLSFSYQPLQDGTWSNLVFAGNSTFANGALQLTPDSAAEGSPSPIANTSGRVWYGLPFKLWSRRKNKITTESFSSTFVLNIWPITQPGGEGLAFILTGDTSFPSESEGQWLGIVNASTNGSAAAQVVAVEFDTRKSYPEDIDDNHVGLDVNSIYSIKQVPLSKFGVNLSNANIMVKVDYDGELERLDIFVSRDSLLLTTNRVISTSLKISDYLPESAYVGFSASTGSLYQLNAIRSWQFNSNDIEERHASVQLWIQVTGPLAIIFFCVTVCYFFWKRCLSTGRRRKDEEREIEERIGAFDMAARKFQLKVLKHATENFHSRNKLGKGGFGTVYKGYLKEINMEVAIKRVSEDSCQGKEEFLAEVTTISQLRHRNLVKLLGWCFEGKELLLVYEFLPEGSLDKLLFHDQSSGSDEPILSWERRHKIIIGVANALDYLHNGCAKRVLHRDIKASNVMLDSDFDARLADFGLARVIQHNEKSHHSTIGMAGTPGYMAPECCLVGRVTAEMDVYAFGVFILEVVCGRRPYNQNYTTNLPENIVDWVWRLSGGRIVDAVDPRLLGQFNVEESDCLLKLGLSCCHPNPNQRPTMWTALQVLSGEAALPVLPPEKPAFVWPVVVESNNYSLNGAQENFSTLLTGR